MFMYQNCSNEYFHIGVRIQQEQGVNYLIATPEKALCDLINFSKGVNLRFVKDAKTFLEEDIRFDIDELDGLDITILKECSLYSRRRKSIESLIKYIENERDL